MLDTRGTFRSLYPSGRRTLYVRADGDDAGSGLTAAAAKRTIQAAVDICRAGDRILVGTGTYGHTQFFEKNGSATEWITLESVPGARPVIDVTKSVASWNASKRNNGIDVQLSSRIAIFGLEVRGDQRSVDPDPSGIAIFRGSSRIAVWGCHVHDFPGGGINCFYAAETWIGSRRLEAGGWDSVDLFFNTINATSRYSTFNTSGISFYGGEDLTGGTIDGRYGYRAVGNYIYDVVCTVPYRPGGFSDVTDGNGISPDSLAVPNSLNPGLRPYLKRGLIEGNVITACGGRGVHIYNSKNIDVVNNTLVGNLRTKSPYISGSTEIDVQLDTPDANNGVTIANNLLAPLHTTRVFDHVAQTITGNTALGGTDAIPRGNQSLRSIGLKAFVAIPTTPGLVGGMPLGHLAPRVVTTVQKRTGSLGYRALGISRQTGSTVAVGAVLAT
ncbi:hypothetical protein AS850_05945 [Frondihabitans sp. 762G35]|uniref:hypothetical protein n=1 Tax=Frondihabitans sp. 762G35 TaxID=1446794 RepID=UPI000D21866A|nr:hypothetical protein [Frondihabitans sp. 762G35]ARC56614.1 hypothetical protein AS850_05945 [Frondihabitans sp. 762G35]